MEGNFPFLYNGYQISSNSPLFFFPNPFIIMVDNEFGNLLIEFQRNTVKSFEGEAFVTIGVDEEGRVSYISIEPLDKELKEGVKRIKNE